MAFFTEDFLQFFRELAPNNNKEWFDLNRKRYENSVKEPFTAFVQHMIARLNQHDKAFTDLAAQDCIFRINRDIRFSRDKTPYKLYMSAAISPGGKKSQAINGIYFELTPEAINVYSGVYEADKDQILDIREGIAAKPLAFNKIIRQASFQELFGEIQGEKNKLLPGHLKEAAVSQPLIYNKQWYVKTSFEPDVITSETLDEVLENCFVIARPLEQFFNQFIHRA